MDKLEYELITLKNDKQYFVLEDTLYNYDSYALILNVEDESDIKIVLQEVKNGKTVLTPVEDKNILRELGKIFEERIKNKQSNLN